MATTNKVQGWLCLLMTEDSSFHWPTKPVLSENANGAARSNPRGVLKTRGDQPTRYWLCDRRPRADLSCRPSVPSNWCARTPMRRRGGNS